MKVKEDFHQLIDHIEDEQLLKGYYQLLQNLSSQKTGELWNKLTAHQKEELIISYNESFDADNLVPHHKVKAKHADFLLRTFNQ